MPVQHAEESTPVYFAEAILGFSLYDWQAEVVTWFEDAPISPVRGTLATPNESGKSSVLIPTLVLWWLFVHKLGKVVVTTKSALQLETQILPAVHRHSPKFQGWVFNERRIITPSGGEAIFFTTDEASRSEGHHPLVDKFTGPVLIIVDEAKSVDAQIFSALDRCGYSGLLYTSSPGAMSGRFYESHVRSEMGFKRKQIGLKDCPHIDPAKIARILSDYGEDHPFTQSTLHGRFMVADGESHFDLDGLKFLREMADAGHGRAHRGVLNPQAWQHNGAPAQTWSDAPDGWIWMQEPPIPGMRYLGFCDPMTGEQSEGSLERDTHAAGIIRAAYTDNFGQGHDAELVAAFYVPSEEEASGCACRWHNDILATRLAMLLRHYGNCPVVVEANNSGTEVIRLLMQENCNLWRREKPNHRNPGHKLDVVGFHTTNITKSYLVGAMEAAIRHMTLDCRFLPAVKQCETFIRNASGAGESQSGCHDDFVFGLGLGVLQLNAAQELPRNPEVQIKQWGGVTMIENFQPPASGYGACA